MIAGFLVAEKESDLPESFSKIVFTFIQNSEGDFLNLTQNSFSDLIDILENDARIDNRVIGIDFCGPEANKRHPLIMKVINETKKYNTFRRKKKKKPLEIMVHIGENLNYKTVSEHLDEIEDYVSAGINRISHGTILWIPGRYLSEGNSRDIQRREKILQSLSKKNIMLEICPSANLTLSPLGNWSEIPFNLLEKIGVQFTVNTDNKTIFTTTLREEFAAYLK